MQPVDPIRSIRIANTLAARYRELSATGATSTSELELAIGEAQQIFPEIWRHLEEARGALVARGRDLSQFDALRREALTQLGVTDIDSSLQVDWADLALGGIGIAMTKTATFNIGGHQLAVAAARALMLEMPDVDWAAIVRAEDREIAAAGSLHSGKWLGIVKAIVAVIAVIVVVIVIHRLATSAGTASATDEPAREPPEDKPENPADRVRRMRRAQIDELRTAYQTTCDRKHLAPLLQLLRDDGQPAVAQQLETAPCVAPRPTCTTHLREDFADRLATELALVRDEAWVMKCKGALIARDTALVPGLAVTITARGTDRTTRTVRGVTSADGTRDLVAFAASPASAQLLGAAELDDAPGDELVFVGGRTLLVTRVTAAGFVDLEGPLLRAGCTADANVEGDFRRGRKGTRKLLVITVPDEPAPAKGCLGPGRHYYALTAGRLEETD
jgi:hypothetical protein